MSYQSPKRISAGGSSGIGGPAWYGPPPDPKEPAVIIDKIFLVHSKEINMPIKNMVGEVFAELTVISFSHTEKGRAFWNCLCSCGSSRVVKGKSLTVGRVGSCGCKKKTTLKDLTGTTIKNLTVLSYSHSEPVGEKSSTEVFWNCLCICGNIGCFSAKSLREGRASCGCLSKVLDISGNIYGRLTALYSWEPKFWLFLCDCGKTCISYKSNVVNGITSSCGCYRLEACTSQLDKVNASGMMKGSGNYKWKGGITPLKKSIRESAAYYLWRNTILKRDEHHCQDCSTTVGDLHVHHIEHLSKIIQKFNIKTIEEALACPLIWDTDNGVTLCENCHQDRHPDIQIIALKRTA